MPRRRALPFPLLALQGIVTLSDCGPLPDTGEKEVCSVVEPPGGMLVEPMDAENPPLGLLCVKGKKMVSVASPIFETVKSKTPEAVPTFTRPKSCDEGVMLMTGPAPARPGANAKVKSPRRTILRKAWLRMVCP